MGFSGRGHEGLANWPSVLLGDNTMAKTPQTGWLGIPVSGNRDYKLKLSS